MGKFRMILGIVLGVLVVMVVGWTLSMMVWSRRVERPAGLGVAEGRLTACPSTPNCVSSQATLESQKMSALRYEGSKEAAQTRLRQVVEAQPRVRLVEEQGDYLAYVFRSRLIGFPDDVEFLFDDATKQIHFRSAARLGQGDLGVNRARMEEIQRLFAAAT